MPLTGKYIVATVSVKVQKILSGSIRGRSKATYTTVLKDLYQEGGLDAAYGSGVTKYR
jgi:hypothetical protein